MKTKVIKYIQLIQNFVDGIIPVQDFEREYLQLVKNESFIFDEDIARIIETLFSDVDAYCGDTEITNYDSNDPFADIDEEELKKRARKALEQLQFA